VDECKPRHCAAHFKEASVLFIEISDFAALSATLAAGELVELLNFVFSTFDDALEAGSLHSFRVQGLGFRVQGSGFVSFPAQLQLSRLKPHMSSHRSTS
jgi:class 3 adenylate cyclase